MSSNKAKRHHDNSMAGLKKAAINNFMNNSKNMENSLINPVKSERLPSREKKKYKRDHKYQDSKSNTGKITKEKLNNGLFNDNLIKPHGLTFKTRKLSADHGKTDKNSLKGIKPSTRSRKTHSGRPSQRQSRADSRDTDSRSHKEDSKSAINNDKPANNQAPSDPAKEEGSKEDMNIVTKFAFATRVGYIPNNPYKVNQDAYILSPNIWKLPAFHYFGVCDGHGQNGKEVSGYVKQRLPVLLENNVKATGDDKKSLTDAFVTVNTELDFVPFDWQFSGTTCWTILFKGNRLISANAGDSRAIVVRNSPSQSAKGVTSIQVEQLTRDHKPDEQDEYTRIIDKGGRIEAFKDINGDPMGPVRVWIQHEDVPGLAMSRSLGDKVAQSVGVIPDPEILDYTLTPNDQFILIASDGVWEFMSNVDVARLVYPYVEKNAPEAAANILVKEATKRWKKEEEVIDDITCIIIFLDIKS